MNTDIKTVKDFSYNEILSDSDNIIKDLARLLSMGVESEEIKDSNGDVIRPASPVVDGCWQIVYPKVDKVLFPNIGDWDNLLPVEYKAVTLHQINKATDTIILKTTTIDKDIVINNSTQIGVNPDLNAKNTTMHLELYMPKYLCDSESDDVMMQRQGTIHRVNDVNNIKWNDKTQSVSVETKVSRNYHHLFMRIFDNINNEGNAPAENIYDPVTRDVLKWNSRSSSWSKLSWYTDFEDKFIAPLVGQQIKGMQYGSIRLPVTNGLSSESKIKIWANINKSRAVLGVMGSPNVDFGDNRYLIGSSYIGQIESFDFSVNDTVGNFGLFCTSSTSPAIGKTEIVTRPLRNGIVSNNQVTNNNTGLNQSNNTFPVLRLTSFSNNVDYTDEFVYINNLPYDYTLPNGGEDWGTRYIDEDSIELEVFVNHNGYSNNYIFYVDENGRSKSIKQYTHGPYRLDNSCFEVDKNDRKKIILKVNGEYILKAIISEFHPNYQELLKSKNIRFGYDYANLGNLTFRYRFKYYTEYTVQTGGVKRDKFGNPISVEFDKTYGKNTATGVTDFAMYATFTKDYFQRHYFMFASTEEYMQKELYGKSAYTGEYFADRIKVVHNSEGPRGILSGMITVDTSSLYPFDELIVNKDFIKYKDKPEELYVYLPITAPYCPFANSPNGRHGIGILKDIKWPEPVTAEQIVDAAIRELERKYANINIVVSDFPLIEESKYGASIAWNSDNESAITVE